MRASRWLRHRAQANRTRYAMRALVTEVLPSLVDSMQTMNDTLRIQSCIMGNHLKTHEPAGSDADPLGSGHSPSATGREVGDSGGSVEEPSTHLIHGSASTQESGEWESDTPDRIE